MMFLFPRYVNPSISPLTWDPFFFFVFLHTSSETGPQMNRDIQYVDILDNRGGDKPHPWQMVTLNMLDLIRRNHKLSVNEWLATTAIQTLISRKLLRSQDVSSSYKKKKKNTFELHPLHTHRHFETLLTSDNHGNYRGRRGIKVWVSVWAHVRRSPQFILQWAFIL